MTNTHSLVETLNSQIESLRLAADGLLEKHGVTFGPREDRPLPPLPELYGDLADLLQAEVNSLEPIAADKETYSDDEAAALTQVLELSFATAVYRALAETAEISALPDPVLADGETVARLMLVGSNLGVLSLFHSHHIETFDAVCQTAATAQEHIAMLKKQSEGATKANLKRTVWYPIAFATHAAYLYFNPGHTKGARFEAAKAVKSSDDPDIKKAIEKLENLEGSLAKALDRHSETYSQYVSAIDGIVKGEDYSGLPELRPVFEEAIGRCRRA